MTEPDSPTAARDQQRVKDLLAIFEGLSLMPALKGVMAERDGQASWPETRPAISSVVALTLTTMVVVNDDFTRTGNHHQLVGLAFHGGRKTPERR